MNVLISWSGDRSRAMARALNSWIPKVIQVAKPWMSAEDISTGARWSDELNQILEETAIGIICITPENQNSIWLHFEAGALSKSISNSKVMPLLLEMSPAQLSGPLSQFQAVECAKTGVLKIVQSVNESLGDRALKDTDLVEIFDVWWPKLENEISEIQPHSELIEKRESNDMLEEILDLLREAKRENKERISKLLDARKEDMNKMMETMNGLVSEFDSANKQGADVEKLKLSFLANSNSSTGDGSLPHELAEAIEQLEKKNPMKGMASLFGNMQESVLRALEESNQDETDDKA